MRRAKPSSVACVPPVGVVSACVAAAKLCTGVALQRSRRNARPPLPRSYVTCASVCVGCTSFDPPSVCTRFTLPSSALVARQSTPSDACVDDWFGLVWYGEYGDGDAPGAGRMPTGLNG